ncbi:MAG TPA: rRNA adenine N-6-methyltransferase family protein [Woeseiaceae bacterium]|nr:rRNA adenine N-6-methyltransferase family protein [Woeseiaceae bacterium]
MPSSLSQNWKFFQAFLRSPRVVASVIPSSPVAVRRAVRAIDPQNARVVVELGAGTGCMTRALLEALPASSQLIVIERTAAFIPTLTAIDDPRLEVVHGCASSIGTEVRRRGHEAADAVISGIPFSTLPEALAARIASEIHAVLAPGGRFVAYQFNKRVAEYARPLMGLPEVELVFRNVPPVRLFTWRKPDLKSPGFAPA